MTFPIKREILLADTDATMRFHMPDHWGRCAAVTVKLRDLDGETLEDTAACDILASTNLSAAVERMDKSLVMDDTVKYSHDDLIRVGSSTQGFQEFFIDSYTSSTKTLTLKNRFDTAYASGSEVEPRFVTININASGWDSGVTEFTAEWVPSTDDLPIVEQWRVLSRTKDLGGLEEIFATLYQSEYNETDGGFDVFENQARKVIKTRWEKNGLDLDKLVDRDDEYERLMLLQIALLLNPSDYNVTAYNDYYNQVLELVKWIDADQDLVQDDEEMIKGTAFNFMRKL